MYFISFLAGKRYCWLNADKGHFKKNSHTETCSFMRVTGPDSLVVRASASGAVDRGFAPRSRHTKGVKNGTSSSLADARIKG